MVELGIRYVKVAPTTVTSPAAAIELVDVVAAASNHAETQVQTPVEGRSASFASHVSPQTHIHPPTTTRRLANQAAPPDVKLEATNSRHRLHAQVWKSALQTLWILLTNAVVASAGAWFANLCISSGNVFASLSSQNQSDAQFAMATMVWTHTICCVCVVLSQATTLLPLRFRKYPDYVPTFPFCVWTLAKRTHRTYVLSLVLLIGVLLLFRSQKTESITTRSSKAVVYCSLLLNHMCSVGTFIASRAIFREQHLQSKASREAGVFAQRPRRNKRATLCTSTCYFAKVYLRTSALLCTILLATAYVHAASRYDFKSTHQALGFSLGSLALKIVVQEIAKVGVLRRKVKDVRTMFVAVGLPTVLIDTQVRIALQRVQSTQFTLTGTLVLAILEVVTRASKLAATRFQIRRRERALEAAASEAGDEAAASTKTKAHKVSSQVDFEQWKLNIAAFQVAELYADMSAEYIAIGCSTAILFFFWDHPKYQLGGGGDTVDLTSSSVLSEQSLMLIIQIGAEIVVDYLSCVFEISAGVDFEQVRKFRVYLGALFISIAVINIQISAVVYVRVW